MIGEENGATTGELKSEYRWQWMKPDRPGVWAWGGRTPDRRRDMVELFWLDAIATDPGWWCFLMDLPTILPPKKKTLWRMWVVPQPGFENEFWSSWVPDKWMSSLPDAIRTDKTEEREE